MGGNPSIFLTKLCPFFDLEYSKCSYSRALAPACGALVKYQLQYVCWYREPGTNWFAKTCDFKMCREARDYYLTNEELSLDNNASLW